MIAFLLLGACTRVLFSMSRVVWYHRPLSLALMLSPHGS